MVVATLAFASVVAAWLTFGVGIELLILLCASQLDELRPVKQRLVDAVTAGLAVWGSHGGALHR